MPDGYQPADRAGAEAQRFLCAEAFGGDPTTALDRVDDDYIGRTRVVKRGPRIAAALHFLDVHQHFGGERLRSWAIAGLVTAAPFRGAGVGRELVLGMLREARAAGVPLSVLYASTPTFYRKCGYEPAGYVCAWGVDAQKLPHEPGALDGFDVVAFEPDDENVRACYAQSIADHHGPFDRDEELWKWKVNPPKGHRFRFRFDVAGNTEGYVSLSGDRSEALGVEDYAATTVRARRAILAFLHGYRAVADTVAWYGGPQDPLRRLITEKVDTPRRHTEEWLLRITDPHAALAKRGYPKIDAELHLDLADASMPENAGRFVLSLSRGEPTVTPGGDGTIRLDVRALAALFTSHCTAEELAATGLIDGPAEALASASAVFAGPRPYLSDKF